MDVDVDIDVNVDVVVDVDVDDYVYVYVYDASFTRLAGLLHALTDTGPSPVTRISRVSPGARVK